MKYSENIYMKALAALAALRTTLSEKEQHTVDFVAEAIDEKADRDTGPATNADRIRSMSDEELAEAIMCPNEFNVHGQPLKCKSISGKDCVKCWLDWLRQPARESGSRKPVEKIHEINYGKLGGISHDRKRICAANTSGSRG